jgi:hypothetical protein
MHVLIRTIGSQRYAYVAVRSNGRTVQTYLGPMTRPDVAARVASLQAEGDIPPQFHQLFWDVDPECVDLRKHARYVIERVLDAGSLQAVWWLQREYRTRDIERVLASGKGLSARSRAFWSAWFEATRAS